MKNKTILIPVVVAIFNLCSCSPRIQELSLEKYRETKLLMGTTIQIDTCHKEGEEALLEKTYKEVWQRLENIHWRMSIYDDKSDVNKINRSYKRPAKVGADTYYLIRDAISYSNMTQGGFDITVGSLVELWKQAGENNVMPTEDEIKKNLEGIGVKHLRLAKENRIEILHPKAKVVLGGIAKGYGIDEAARILRANKLNDFFIDAGGDVYVSGLNCSRRPWRIGIRNPRDPEKFFDVIETTNAAVTTSGDYAQFFEIKGKRFSHIISPLTGYPQKGIVSATVIAPNATLADALSTALTVLTPQQGIQVIDSLGEGYGSLTFSQKEGRLKPHKSQNYKK